MATKENSLDTGDAMLPLDTARRRVDRFATEMQTINQKVRAAMTVLEQHIAKILSTNQIGDAEAQGDTAARRPVTPQILATVSQTKSEVSFLLRQHDAALDGLCVFLGSNPRPKLKPKQTVSTTSRDVRSLCAEKCTPPPRDMTTLRILHETLLSKLRKEQNSPHKQTVLLNDIAKVEHELKRLGSRNLMALPKVEENEEQAFNTNINQRDENDGLRYSTAEGFAGTDKRQSHCDNDDPDIAVVRGDEKIESNMKVLNQFYDSVPRTPSRNNDSNRNEEFGKLFAKIMCGSASKALSEKREDCLSSPQGLLDLISVSRDGEEVGNSANIASLDSISKPREGGFGNSANISSSVSASKKVGNSSDFDSTSFFAEGGLGKFIANSPGTISTPTEEQEFGHFKSESLDSVSESTEGIRFGNSAPLLDLMSTPKELDIEESQDVAKEKGLNTIDPTKHDPPLEEISTNIEQSDTFQQLFGEMVQHDNSVRFARNNCSPQEVGFGTATTGSYCIQDRKAQELDNTLANVTPKNETVPTPQCTPKGKPFSSPAVQGIRKQLFSLGNLK